MSTPQQPTTNASVQPVLPLPAAPSVVWPLYAAISIVAVAVLVTVAVIATKGGETSTPIVVSVLGFGAALLVQLTNSIATTQVKRQVEAIHVDVNSRLTQLTETVGKQNMAEGVAIGVEQQRQQTAADTLALAEAKATAARLEVELAGLRTAIVPAAPVTDVQQGVTAVKVVGQDGPVAVTVAPEKAGV